VKLSGERATAVAAGLVERGLAKDMFVAKGFGPDKPIADNATEEGKDKNRRVEFVITDPPAKH
jgi:OmpA-OmpF porin, OOP family